ncbi:MAG TPA: prepilin-type N-terminal cleavage/methylation domain-containing protein, partial [Longimicrobiales bacterium]|nr:prepilin-type N-terminal cleavage/methylation domain-containing protein [Longimicrobiales bacterium]
MRNGFTIVELLFVVIILAILAGVAVPRLNRPRVDTAARDLSMALLAAQNRALLLQQDVQARFDTVAGRVTVIEAPGSTDERTVVPWEAPAGVTFGPAPEDALAIGERAVTFRDEDGAPTLTFHRGGAASEWGGVY